VELASFSSGPGEFFKPATYKDAIAILAQPTGFRPDVPTPKFGPKDEVTATLTVFKSEADFDYANGSAVTVENSKIQQTALAKSLRDYVGKAIVVRLDQFDSGKGNPAWVFESVDKEVQDKVVAWIKAREAELEDCPI
jgi:hypothetical protein